MVIRESRAALAERSFDPLGAVSITSSTILLVYSISKAPDVGWGAASTIILLIVAGALFALFLVVETRVRAPLVPLRIFRLKTVTAANVVGFLLGTMLFSMFFLLTIYVQEVLGYSALKTGVTFLATAGTAIIAAGIAEALIGRIGAKTVMAIGMAMFAAALLYYTRISVHGSYFGDLFLGYVLAGFGLGFSFVPDSVVALSGVDEDDSGLASGLINTSQNIGGAVGLAVAATIFTTRVNHELPKFLASGKPPQEAAHFALVSGFHLAFLVLAIVAFIGLAATLLLLRGVSVGHEEVPAHATPACGWVPNRAATAHVSSMITGDDATLGSSGAAAS